MAAVDYFLKIDGIDGESADAKHKGEIDLESFSLGATNSGTFSTGGGGGAGKVVFHDFHFVMKSNKASPKVFLACASGEHIKKAVLTCRKAGKDQQEFLKYVFSDCLISSFQTGGSAHGEIIPTDQVTVNFAKFEKEYKEQKADGTLGGSIKSGWDLKANTKV
jgi:type VI secretion system secreted protein Hcp